MTNSVHIVNTYTAQIFLGLKDTEAEDIYGDVLFHGRLLHEIRCQSEAISTCQKYVDEFDLCVTCTPTEFIYSNGKEPGLIIGLINYPRFPSTNDVIRKHAVILAEKLKEQFRQKRISIVCSDETIMLGEKE